MGNRPIVREAEAFRRSNAQPMRVLSLFSGVGLHDLGLERAGLEIAGQCECDPWCLAVLEKHWPSVARFEEVRDVTGGVVAGRCGNVDLVTGGFPCQDISSAGRGSGLDGARSGLWWEMRRVIEEVRPSWVLVENVPALRLRGADRVVSSLEEVGYSVLPPVVVGAWAVGAPHRRQRVWIVAHTSSEGLEGWQSRPGDHESELPAIERGHLLWPSRPGQEQYPWEAPRLAYSPWNGGSEQPEDAGADRERTREVRHSGVVYADIKRLSRGDASVAESYRPGLEAEATGPSQRGICDTGPPESRLGRATDGRARRLVSFARRNRLKALGNANPWVVPYLIGRWMMSTTPAGEPTSDDAREGLRAGDVASPPTGMPRSSRGVRSA